jgi:hypothetical protein
MRRRMGGCVSNALIHCAGRFSTRWLPLLLLAPVTPAAAAEALDYSYVELGYAIDSTIETYGKSYDSDSSFRVNASYLFDRHFFLSAQYYSAGYDLEDNDDFSLSGFSLGLGYRGRISGDDARPVDWFVQLSYERNDTQSEVDHVDYETGRDGGGLKAGIRAAVIENLELNFAAFEQSFGSEFATLGGDLSGLSFELGGALKLNDRYSLTAAYKTGELDYKRQDSFPGKWEIELDQDEVFVGVRAAFR